AGTGSLSRRIARWKRRNAMFLRRADVLHVFHGAGDQVRIDDHAVRRQRKGIVVLVGEHSIETLSAELSPNEGGNHLHGRGVAVLADARERALFSKRGDDLV